MRMLQRTGSSKDTGRIRMIELRSNDFYKLGKYHQKLIMALLKTASISKEAFLRILQELKLLIENCDLDCTYCVLAKNQGAAYRKSPAKMQQGYQSAFSER